MKKFLSLLLVSAMMLSFVPMFGTNYAYFLPKADAATEAKALVDGYFTYTIDENGNATIIRCDISASGYIEVPSNLGGYPVVAVGDRAFSDCDQITSIVFSDGLLFIGNSAFEECFTLENITVPDGLVSIGNRAFYYCNKLIGIKLPESLINIGDEAFGDCESLKTINVPSSVRSIGSYAFYKCSALTSDIIIPNGVTAIKHNTFSSCQKLTKVKIPATVTSIGSGAFSHCSSLESIILPEDITNIASGTFEGCKSLTEIKIPKKVTCIDSRAFYGCSGILQFDIPDSVREIGNQAFSFSGFYNDESNWENDILYIDEFLVDVKNSITGDISVKNGTKYIIEKVFYNHQGLESIVIPGSVVEIFTSTFENCRNLKSVEIGNGVTVIGETAFKDCDKLENVIIGDGVKSIGYQAFYGCGALKEIIIPGNVKQIGDEAFSYCRALKKVVINEGVNVIGKGAFTACSSLTDISISDSITEIKPSAFIDCDSLETIVLPMNIKYIDAFLFYGCSSLENVTIPDGVEKIMGKTFWECSNLKEITIPESVTYIGEHAFAYCQNLESVYIPSGVVTIGMDAFLTGGNLKEITVDIKNAYYSSDEHGALFNKDKTCLIQYPGGKTEEEYQVPHGVKKIIDDAFISSLKTENYDLVFSNVKKLYIPKSLGLIENNYSTNADTVYKYVSDIYYEGTQEEYEQIENITTYFPNATIHPNSYNQIVDDEPSVDDVPEMPTVENPVVLDWEEGCFGKTEVTEVYECIENDFEKGGVYISENDETYTQFALYKIKILGENGEIVQPEDGYEVTVRIFLPQKYKDIKNFYVVHWFNNGGREKIYDVKNENGCLVFKTKSFSEFAICADLDFGFENDSVKLNYKSEKNFSATTDSKTKVVYSSSDESVATVDSNGNIKAVGIGSATITATIDGTEISDSINITVSYAWWQWIIRILLLGFLWY